MFQAPPFVYAAPKTTGAVAFVGIVVPMLAAPGAFFTYRLVGAHVVERPAFGGGAVVVAAPQDALTGTNLGYMSIDDDANSADSLIIPEPGIQLTLNAPMQLYLECNLATQFIYITIYYYIDSVT